MGYSYHECLPCYIHTHMNFTVPYNVSPVMLCIDCFDCKFKGWMHFFSTHKDTKCSNCGKIEKCIAVTFCKECKGEHESDIESDIE